MIFEELASLPTEEIEKRLDRIIEKLGIAVHENVISQMYTYIEMYQAELMERMVIADWNAHLPETLKPLNTEDGGATPDHVEKGTRPERKRVRFNK